MKYGFALSGRGPLAEPDALSAIARRGDELGFDWVLTGDHIVVPNSIDSTYPYTEGGEFPGSASGVAMEQLTVLSFLAGQFNQEFLAEVLDYFSFYLRLGGGGQAEYRRRWAVARGLLDELADVAVIGPEVVAPF